MSDDRQTTDDEIRALVTRLSRPGPDDRRVIERAAILAEGSASAAILAWLEAASWAPQDDVPQTAGLGLHGARRDAQRSQARAPRRYVSPPAGGR